MKQIIKKQCINTKRLQLKPFSINDETTLISLLTNENITKTYMVPEFESMEQVKALASKLINMSQINDVNHLVYGIYLNNTLIGFINDCGFNDEEIEIGYVIDPNHKGNGYAPEAVCAILKELKYMGFKKVMAGFFEDNQDSYRVMEKCGMKRIEQTSIQEYRGKQHTCYYCEKIL